ncbi:MAG: proton-conducting transporter membrane subunit [Myxococcota bacterium]
MIDLGFAAVILLVLAAMLSAIAPARVTAALSVLGGACASGAGLAVLYGAPPEAVRYLWPVPGGALAFRLDALGAIFLVPIGVVGALGAVYALGYWSADHHPRGERFVRGCYALMTAAMVALVLCENGVAFLAAWEVMALSAFFLVGTEHEKEEVRAAAYLYLIAAHTTVLGSWWMFSRIESATGTFGFAPLPASTATTLTVLVGIIAFGIKAGFVPLHVWLPSAHASAPSHVSALLSGVVLKMGVYGILRVASLATAALPAGIGAMVFTLGALSAVVGVLFALGQHDLKRLLAYHSIENIGIILLGVGLALLGQRLGHPLWVVLGLGGALLHVWNHAFFKSLLFLGAGSVVHATGTRQIDLLGGLAKSQPYTALFFLVGAIAITGLPPLNGLVSELLLYLGLFDAARPDGAALVAVGAPALALAGALALACFIKVYGAVFLGEARSDVARGAHEVPATMLTPMGILAGLCLTIGLAPWLVMPALDRAVTSFAHGAQTPGLTPLATHVPLAQLSGLAVALLGATVLGWLWQRRRATGATPRAVTWDCGYAAPTARMQYTASSFADTLVTLFRGVLHPTTHDAQVRNVLPGASHFATHVDDVVLEGSVLPAFRRAGRALMRARPIQSGRVQVYMLYIFVAMVVMLAATLPVGELVEALWQH